ncbi:MAG TPA: glycosyltransferase family 39 protein [Candidatus Diapherotrites archaeon]|nr:glycosyltransferase family 39 protein [Candidatus Diapherotrites archaeon]
MEKNKVNKIKEHLKNSFYKYWAICIFLLLIIIGALLIFKSPTLFWDEGVYINNAKYIYSLGEQSTYESIRPPLFPIIIGLSIPLGIDILIFSKIFIFLCFLLGILAIYLISEKIQKGSGVFSAISLFTCSLIVFVLPHILTDFIVLTFMLIAFYFYINKKYFLSGLFCGVSVLLRFPSGLLFIILGLFLFEKDIKKAIKNILIFASGFLILIVPYLISNKIFFGSFLKPIINAQLIVAQGGSNFLGTAWFFIKVLISQNLILIFIILFIILVLSKKMKDKNHYLLLTLVVAYFIYFAQLPHYEDRYILLLIPFGAIITGIVISYFLNKISNIKLKHFVGIATLIFLLIFVIFILLISKNIYNIINGKTEIKFLKEIGEINTERLFIYDPITGIYFNKKLNCIVNPYYTNKFIERYPDVNYMVLSEKLFDCNNVVCMDCDGADQCLEEEKLKETLNREWEIIKSEKLYGFNYYIYSKK